MTRNEFQKHYHEYRIHDRRLVQIEAKMVNDEGVTNEKGIVEHDAVVAVDFGSDLGCALMLKSAAIFMGYIKKDQLLFAPKQD